MDSLISQSVRGFLTDLGQASKSLGLLGEKYKIDSGRLNEIITLRNSYLADELEAQDLPDLLVQAFGLTPELARQMAADILGYFLLPLQNYIPAVAAEIVALGGKLSDYPSARVPLETLSPEQIVNKLLTEQGITLPADLAHRLMLLTSNYLEKHSTRESTKNLLMRDTNIGGMALSAEAAENILLALDAENVQAAPAVVPEPTPVAAPEAVSVPEPVQEKIIEQKLVVKAAPPLALLPKPNLPVKTVTHALATAVPVISGEFINPQEKSEVKEHVAAAIEAKKQLSPIEADLLARAENLTNSLWSQIKVDTNLTKTQLNALVTSAMRGVRGPEQVERILRDQYKLEESKIDSFLEKLVDEKNMHAVLFAPVTIATAEEQAASEKREAEAKREADILPPVKPAPVIAEVSAPTIHASVHGEQKVTDIVYKKTLVGPLDQLGQMTIADFRRLASKPEDITNVILAQVNSLGEGDYAQRLSAIKAWQQSPVQQLYVRLLREAVTSGTAISELIAAARGRGEEVISPAEVQAIMQLNKRLG